MCFAVTALKHCQCFPSLTLYCQPGIFLVLFTHCSQTISYHFQRTNGLATLIACVPVFTSSEGKKWMYAFPVLLLPSSPRTARNMPFTHV